MSKRVLMIAYHFPPLRGSSGIQRTLSFVRHLPEFGWEPVVLTAHPRAYPATGNDQSNGIPDGVPVHPAFALDTARHLSFRGRYARAMALPDRWASWWLGAVPLGLHLIRKYRPSAIWSTYPIATAHLIGMTLQRLTGTPWVADFRDPMLEKTYPAEPAVRKAYGRIEAAALKRCSHATLTTPGALRDYAVRFPDVPGQRFSLIENGYDETVFADAFDSRAPRTQDQRFVLVHSGIVYPKERNPVPLFDAVAALRRQAVLGPDNFQLLLRATGHDAFLQRLIRERQIDDVVTLAPAIPYREALAEMLSADGLLLLQAGNCNNQIPAKLYEYLRAQRPIFALTDAGGDTAGALRKAGVDTIADLESRDGIARALAAFLEAAREGRAPIASLQTVMTYSRMAKTGELAGILDAVASVPRAAREGQSVALNVKDRRTG